MPIHNPSHKGCRRAKVVAGYRMDLRAVRLHKTPPQNKKIKSANSPKKGGNWKQRKEGNKLETTVSGTKHSPIDNYIKQNSLKASIKTHGESGAGALNMQL